MPLLLGCKKTFSRFQNRLDCGPRMPDDKALDRAAVLLMILWMVIWTIVPALMIGNACIDVSENIAWGQHFQFGYDKNPYVGAWLTSWAYRITGFDQISYFLSQCCVFSALFCMWRLALKITRSSSAALISVILLMLIPVHSATAFEFNDDVIEIGLWAPFLLFFYRSLEKQRIMDWILVGVFGGLSFMTKYFGAALFLSLLVLLIFTPRGRVSWKKPGIYLAAIVVLALSAPNLYWLYKNDFVAFKYATDRAGLSVGTGPVWSDHFANPFDLVIKTVTMLLVAVPAMLIFFRRGPVPDTASPSGRHFDLWFVSCALSGVFIQAFLFALVTGGEVKFSWMTPCFLPAGLFLVLILRPQPTMRRLRWLYLVLGATVVFTMLSTANGYLYRRPYLRNRCPYESFPGKACAEDLTQAWRNTFNTPLKYVIAERTEACNMVLYSPDRPAAYFSANDLYSQWIDKDDLRRSGALILWSGDETMAPDWVWKFQPLRYLPARVYERPVPSWFRTAVEKISGKRPKVHHIFAAFLLPAPDVPPQDSTR